MNPVFLGPVLEIGKTLLDRFGPEDKNAKLAAEGEMVRMVAQGELAIILKQLEINAAEAAHPSIWTSGWRPYFGWVGGTAFAYVCIARPFLGWIAAINGWPEPPNIDTEFLWIVVSGLLGLGGMRSIEKFKGVSK
jgi:Holin of 3TMs, for gene-transfer release